MPGVAKRLGRSRASGKFVRLDEVIKPGRRVQKKQVSPVRRARAGGLSSVIGLPFWDTVSTGPAIKGEFVDPVGIVTRQKRLPKTIEAVKPVHRCPSHTKRVFDIKILPHVVDWSVKCVKKEKADAIVACGHSGLVLAGIVGYLTKIPVFAVRKKGEPTIATGGGQVTAIAPNGKAQHWVWLDDFVCEGRTLRHACSVLQKAGLVETVLPQAVILYNDWDEEEVGPVSVKSWYLDKWVELFPDFNFAGARYREYRGARTIDIECR